MVAEPGGSSDNVTGVLFSFSCAGFEEGAQGWFAWSCSELARKLFTVSSSLSQPRAARAVQRAEQHQSRELFTHSICTRGGWKGTCGTFLYPEVPSIVLVSENRSVAELLSAVALEDNVQADFNLHHVSGGASS